MKKFIKDEKITRISFLANAGGLLGLCMGFSVISVAEIFYHCLVSLATSFNRANGGTADKTAADSEDTADTVVSCAEVAAVGRVEYERRVSMPGINLQVLYFLDSGSDNTNKNVFQVK